MAKKVPACLNGITIGRTAVFIEEAARERIGPLQVTLPAIVSRLGDGKLGLLNLEIPKKKVSKTSVRGMFPVKMVFGRGESVFLAIWDPESAGKKVEFKIEAANSVPVAGWPVEMDAYGLSVQEVSELPEGSYTASLGDLTATFTVAQHTLAPLNAEYIRTPRLNAKDKEAIECTVRLMSWGKPCREGEQVRVELMQGRSRKGSKELKLQAGSSLDVEFDLPKGEEVLTLNFIMGSKTASLPLRGAKESERKVLVASSLGQVFEVSTLGPGEECRSFFINPGASNNEPVLVESIVGEAGKITFRQKADAVLLQVINPVTGTVTPIERREVAAGSSLEVPFKDFCVVYVAAFINGKPYEAATMFLQPSHLSVTAEVPEEVEPGEEVSVTLRTNSEKEVPVLLTVLDSRAVMPSTMGNEAARCMKLGATALMEGVKTGVPESDLEEVMPPGFEELLKGLRFADPRGGFRFDFFGGPEVRDARYLRGDYDSPMLMPVQGDEPEVEEDAFLDEFADEEIGASIDSLEACAADVYTAEAEPSEDEMETATTVETKQREKFPEVVLCRVVYVKGSQQVKFTAPDTITSLTVCVQAINGLDVVVTEEKLEVTKALWAEMETPLFISDDEATGSIHVSCRAGAFSLKLACDGAPVELLMDGEPVDGKIEERSADLTFPVDWPGIYELTVSDGEHTDVSVRTVSEIGSISYVARTLTFLRPGESFAADEKTLWMKPLPGLEKQIVVATEAAAATQYDCCHQTACKIRGACMMYLGGDDGKKSRAESIILAGIAREKSMHVPGKGFNMYPDYGSISRHYSELASQELYMALKPLSGASGLSPALKEACKRGLEMAEDVAKAHGISFAPKTIASCGQAYLAFFAGKKQEAVKYALACLKQEGDYMVCDGKGAVEKRAETAYAAAVLLLDGKHLEQAIRAANFVASQMKDGGWYSTVDTAAGLAMLGALASSEVVVSGEAATTVELNDQSMSLSDALAFQGAITQISMPADSKGVLAVQVCQVKERDLTVFNSRTPLSVSLERDGKAARSVKPGDELALKVKLTAGYKPGDLLVVMLPSGLSFVYGGAQVKTLSLDFAGQDELEVPLAVTCSEACEQSFLACVTNMFEEERGGSQGPVKFAVAA